MKRKWKIWLIVVAVLVLAISVPAAISYSKRGIITVQTGRVTRQDLTSVVTASGEVKPRNYINIGSEAFGRLTAIYVKEGDRVRKGQVLARLDSIQAAADVSAQSAAVNSASAESSAAEAGARAAEENIRTAQASVDRAKADLERSRTTFARTEQLYQNKLIAQSEFDLRKAEYDSAMAAVREAEARLSQVRAQSQQYQAQVQASQKRVTQGEATLKRSQNALDKHNVQSPIDGVVTNLPVRVGETMVVGIQNAPGSTIMTIADMSVITAEVKVDETDIVNVTLGQTADVTIDAIPGKTFKGHVIEIGNTAILRSTGVAASQSAISSQEAKDFKVVVALDAPPDEIRPGLSCTAKITTATRQNVLTIPIQALTVRQKGDLETAPDKKKSGVQAASTPDPAAEKARKEELQGVFAIQGESAVFRKVETGITGATDIEVLGGLKEGDQIVTGSYKAIRTMKNATRIKVDNNAKMEPAKSEG
ncbi:MAG TPA: efflux RND transporter periplasmic adaptor subunit [Bryobacteraceae bacterium]|nr:efflux RND transporter periplasmic adaptor subunit [Bryobacteraceae bacterium]